MLICLRLCADSKALTAEKRDSLLEALIARKDILGWATNSISPHDISTGMLRKRPVNLNAQSTKATIDLISGFLEAGADITEVRRRRSSQTRSALTPVLHRSTSIPSAIQRLTRRYFREASHDTSTSTGPSAPKRTRCTRLSVLRVLQPRSHAIDGSKDGTMARAGSALQRTRRQKTGSRQMTAARRSTAPRLPPRRPRRGRRLLGALHRERSDHWPLPRHRHLLAFGSSAAATLATQTRKRTSFGCSIRSSAGPTSSASPGLR